ncbi:hypothetical protein AGMMS49992_00990 [Clostridia bacterium]|nr:hypothetical protein AGMMS49992_00990 [Clostridia bacterium]
MSFQLIQTEHVVLLEARAKLGLTQVQAAHSARIPLEQYQWYESGEKALSAAPFDIACKVLFALGLDPTTYARGEYIIRSKPTDGPEKPRPSFKVLRFDS